jgi:hypothetical protein
MRKLVFFLVLFIVSACLSNEVDSQDPLIGSWTGQKNTPFISNFFTMKIKVDGTGVIDIESESILEKGAKSEFCIQRMISFKTCILSWSNRPLNNKKVSQKKQSYIFSCEGEKERLIEAVFIDEQHECMELYFPDVYGWITFTNQELIRLIK